MQIVKQKKARRVDASPTTSVEEYLMKENRIGGSTVIISGRYPEKGNAINLISTELVLVLSGNGVIGHRGKETPIEMGDCILLKPKEKYYWNGHLALFIVCTPTWKSRQHKVIA
jgi:mannose-6-phosphate isomerase-like protein (cupin superfamily)